MKAVASDYRKEGTGELAATAEEEGVRLTLAFDAPVSYTVTINCPPDGSP